MREPRAVIVRAFAVVFGGAASAQILSLLVLPLLARVYTPSQFGQLTLVLAVSGVAGPVTMLRLEGAVMLPKDLEMVRALTRVSLVTALVVSALTAVIVEVLAQVGLLGSDPAPLISVWTGVITFLTGVFTLLTQLALRLREFGLVGRRSFLQGLVTSVTQLGFGIASMGIWGLLSGAALGRMAGIVTMARTAREYLTRPSRVSTIDGIKEYWRFPAFFAPSALLNAVGLQAPLIYFTIAFGISTGGQVGIADRIVGLPVTLIGIAAGQVFEAEVARRLRDDHADLGALYMRFSAMLAIPGAILIIGGMSIGGFVVPWVLGEEWRVAGTVVQILSLNAGIRLIATPVSRLLVLTQRTREILLLDIARVMAVGGAMVAVTVLRTSLEAALWIVYSALTATYVATWISGMNVGKQLEGAP